MTLNRQKKLGEFISISKGTKLKDIFDEQVKNSKRYIQIDDLRNNNNLKYTLDNGVEVNKSDLIIAWDGANAGTIGYGLNGLIGSTLAKLKIEDNNVFAPFVGRFLQKKFQYIRNNCTGATIPYVSRNVLENIKIPLPQIEEQKRIDAILDKTDTLRQKRKESIRLLNEFLRSVFLDMFGEKDLSNSNYDIKTLDEISKKITDGTHDTPIRLTEGIKFITGKHIRPFNIDFKNSDYVSIEDHAQIYKRCNPEYDDILYTHIGANIGTAARNSVKYEFSMKNVALIKPDKEKISSRFLEFILNLPSAKSRILGERSIGGAQRFFSIKRSAPYF